MAVPKKKTSKSKVGQRMGGNGSYKTTLPNVMFDKDTGEFKLSHHISIDGYYNGRKVIKEKIKKNKEKNSDSQEANA